MTITKTWWFLPLFSLALGGACFAALALGGETGLGVQAFGVMAVLAVLLAIGGRSETIRGLRGDGRDERFARIDLVATALAGHVLIGSVIAMCLWEWAHGRDGSPYTQLGAVAGLAYIAALALLRWRG
jgi:hypothetical protein